MTATTPLRILVLGLNFDPEPTGIAPYTTGAVDFLADAGHDVRVVTGYPHYPYWKIAEGYGGMRIHERRGPVQVTRVRHPVPSNPTGGSRIATEAAFALHAAAVRGPRPDVVVAVSPALLTVASALRWRRDRATAVGVVVQDLYGRAIAETGALGGRGARAAAALERGLLRRADGVVAIHDTFRDSMVDLGVDPSRITVIRNWTHISAGAGAVDVAALRERLGWRSDETIALHAGNMGAKQGLENVVDAARLADERRLPVRFVLLGAGNKRAELERAAAGVERLQFVDPLPAEDFATALAAADMLVLNERPEVAEMCVPSKLTSYFAAGRPVLAASSPRSAATLEVTASGAGIRVNAGAPDELLSGVLRLGADPAAATSMGERGRRYAADLLAESAARAAYVRWVEQLASITARRGLAAAPAPMPPRDARSSLRLAGSGPTVTTRSGSS